MRYDRDGDQHYDVISAFIKSIRGSDVDAALHYLARMLVAGEDPRFIARRLMILASEDIGMADPTALQTAVAAAQAVAADRDARRPADAGAGHRRTSPSRRSPTPSPSRSARPRPTSAAGWSVRCRRTCATATTRARPTSATAWATSTRTTYPAGSPTSSTRPDQAAGRRYYAPTRYGAEARYADVLDRLRVALGREPAPAISTGPDAAAPVGSEDASDGGATSGTEA